MCREKGAPRLAPCSLPPCTSILRNEIPTSDSVCRHARRHQPLRQSFGRGPYHLNRYRSEEHTSELQSHLNLVCRLLLEKKKRLLHSLRRRTSRNTREHQLMSTKG